MLSAISIRKATRAASWACVTVAVMACHWPGDAAAQSPAVHFDMNPVAACRNVTSPEFEALNPDERLVEADFEISALIRQGDEDDLLQFFYRLELQDAATSVVDYSPKTTLASDQASNVTKEERTERSNHVGVVLTSPLDWPGKLTASSDLGQKSMGSTRYELVPEMTAVTASGTVQRGRGVYFKLRPSRSHTLEGARRFSVVMRVPAAWRGGYAQWNCTASGIGRGLVRTLDERIQCGERRFVVALYLDGDAEAKAAAQRLVRAETDLWRVVTTRRAEIERLNRPTFRDRLEGLIRPAGTSISLSKPRPSSSTESRDSTPLGDVSLAALEGRHLPPDVEQALAEFRSASTQLRGLQHGVTCN
jgi:hypothetical protein